MSQKFDGGRAGFPFFLGCVDIDKALQQKGSTCHSGKGKNQCNLILINSDQIYRYSNVTLSQRGVKIRSDRNINDIQIKLFSFFFVFIKGCAPQVCNSV